MAWSIVTNANLAVTVLQNINISTWNAGSLGAAVSANDKIIAVATFEYQSSDQGAPLAVTGITDSLGNTWNKDLSLVYTDGGSQEEISTWSTVSAAGTPSNITLTHTTTTTSRVGSIAFACQAFGGLSTSAGAAGIDISKITNGTADTTADSGTTAATTGAANELKVGLYADDGWTQTLTAGTLDVAYTMAVKHDTDERGETAIEYADSGASGSTARATMAHSVNTSTWAIAVVVYKLAAAGLTLALTGNAGAAAVGTAATGRTIATTGITATGSVGSLTPSNAIAVTGLAMIGTIGTTAPSATLAVSGVAGTGAVGTITASVGGNLTLAITGVAGTGAAGTVTITASGADKWGVCEMLSVYVNPSPHTAVNAPIPIGYLPQWIGPSYTTQDLAIAAAKTIGTDRAPQYGPPLGVLKR